MFEQRVIGRAWALAAMLPVCLAGAGCDGQGAAVDAEPTPDAAPPDTGADLEPEIARRADARVRRDRGVDDAGVADAAPPDAGEPDAAPPAGACPDYTARRRPLFGDLHVHTSFSFDSYGLRNPRNGPAEAYRYGRGEEVTIPPYDEDGNSTRPPLSITRPLDFTAVTDHAEFLGEVTLCTTEGSAAYDTVACVNFRNSSEFEEFAGVDISFASWGAGLALPDPERPRFCDRPMVDCPAAQREGWARLQALTEEAQAVDPCVFTALHAYEYTGTPGGSMNHRNVIFRTADLPEAPITALDANDWQGLAEGLLATCNDAPDKDCEALAIPHNSNYSNGVLFDPTMGDGRPLDAATAALRARMEPLVEIVQAKQESECRNGFSAFAGPADEACDFEKRDPEQSICGPADVPCGLGENPEDDDCVACLRECAPGETGAGCVSPLDYVRNVIKAGMVQLVALGVNPFKLGFIGSTDTHNATPGNVDEAEFEGHHGFQDDEPDELLDDESRAQFALVENPGGLAVVWAEENSRDAIFRALKRRETYATSGTRPAVRFYGGVPADICDAADFVAVGDAEGAPMGGDLGPVIDGAPVLAVHATQDPDGVGLQQVQIVKTWVDAAGAPQEAVFDITPEPDYSADVDLADCRPRGPSRPEICAVWTDPDFDPDRPAAYYARVFEVPTCRWTTWMCLREGVDCDDPEQAVAGCCGDGPKTIRERAWTSPVFYEP